MEEEWIDTVPLVGISPFEWRNVYRTRATIDECDFNIHLSNSSYAKILDASRLECVVTLFPVFFRSGGAMALGATHFHFMREIPPFQDFEIRSYIGSWDRKWLYLVSKYVTKPKEGSPSSPPPFFPQQQSHLPSPASSGTSTPTIPIPYQSLLVEKDGWVVHTVAVAQLCFKAGRITVPPSIVLASNGFCVFPYTSPIPYSTISTDPSRKPNPPPHWAEVKKLVSPKHGGSLRKYFEFLRSGWKEVRYEDGERWWETALGGEVEAQRERALAELELLKKGLEGARSTFKSSESDYTFT
ncbi:hypothetical protein CC1G_12455 [Coprinopsis cinerea okayama7|uniref:Thioesterase n=1 Tax=Coprinopsis cinerea (strain Okayama-7 / 130 / ATCC MYA-4618 / FGSC 9003) TaxID=240176 RepID=A8NKZ2_COPC7|nr:hypothetical protein CC1G_12455 [Coprinopsis cinerea okayama7\|eukprot:XP_001834577.2 hypothetical protein CC1G_12455 [Coprinopsis cinerea okayama7\